LYAISYGFVLLLNLMVDHRHLLVAQLENPLAIPVAVAVGFLLYWLRSKNKPAYGFLEMLVALGAMYIAITTPDQTPAVRVIALASAIYILIRALDNMKPNPPPGLRWILRKLS
jgi:ABC-type tungstate transport system substrate-binding protein